MHFGNFDVTVVDVNEIGGQEGVCSSRIQIQAPSQDAASSTCYGDRATKEEEEKGKKGQDGCCSSVII